jgi:hypothetical protein
MPNETHGALDLGPGCNQVNCELHYTGCWQSILDGHMRKPELHFKLIIRPIQPTPCPQTRFSLKAQTRAVAEKIEHTPKLCFRPQEASMSVPQVCTNILVIVVDGVYLIQLGACYGLRQVSIDPTQEGRVLLYDIS